MPKPAKLLKKGFKFPIYPTTEQKQLIERTFGCCRYVYNRALAESKEDYKTYAELLEKRLMDKQARPDVSSYGLVNKLPRFKRDPDSTWLSDVSAVALQQSLLHLLAGQFTFCPCIGQCLGIARYRCALNGINCVGSFYCSDPSIDLFYSHVRTSLLALV